MAKGGGSWKVAYADFVTAMMAFFMVMWIGSQDQSTRQAVANYFIDPSGVSKKPAKTGAIFKTTVGGGVPDAEKTAMGRGRDTYTSPNENSRSTKVVGESLLGDSQANTYWREQARAARTQAATLPDVVRNKQSLEEAATKILARQMRDKVAKSIPEPLTGVHQDLLYSAIVEVNWEQLAEDVLRAVQN
jgi:chemotaxis protein MotB